MPPSPEKQFRKNPNNDREAANDVQDDWEDVSDEAGTSRRRVKPSGTSGSLSANTASVRKKRRIPAKATLVPSPTSGSHSATGRKKVPIVEEGLQEVLTHGARYTATYAFDVLKGAVEKMRIPLSWFLFGYMLLWLVSCMTPTIRTALSPLCIFPGVSKTTLCVPDKPPPVVNFRDLVDTQGSTLNQVARESAGGSQLSTGVLKAEMATRDLSILVRQSDLTSKDSIADALDTIALDAKRTGRGLSRLNAKVAGAVDDVIALDSYAMATIGNAHNNAPSALLQAIVPFKLGPTAEEIITETFTFMTDESKRAIEKLVLEAEISRRDLDLLDADITVLQEIVTREEKFTAAERDKLLGELWTKWGNKMVLRDYEDRLALLNKLTEYRKQAAVHVKATLRALHAMIDDIQVLRDKVAGPGLDNKVPVHVHMEAIRNGVARLQEGRATSRGRSIEYDDTVRALLDGSPG